MAEKQTDWLTPLAVIGGGGILLWGAWSLLKKEEGKLKLEIGLIETDKYSYQHGETVSINVPIANRENKEIAADLKITIMQGAKVGSGDIVPGGVMNLPIAVPANSTEDFVFTYNAEDLGGDATRDIDADLTVSGQQVDHVESDDVFRVEGIGAILTIQGITTGKYSYLDGESVTITIPVRNNSDDGVTANLQITIMQGAKVGSGDIVPGGIMNKNINVPANSLQNFTFNYVAEDLGGDATRDIDADLTVSGQQVDHVESDDVFRVEGIGGSLELVSWSTGKYSYQDGETVTIQVVIENSTPNSLTGNLKITIMQGALVGSGDIVPGGILTKSVTVLPNNNSNVIFYYTAEDLGGDATRDIDFDLTIEGEQVDHKEDDDVFRVESGGGNGGDEYTFLIESVDVLPYSSPPTMVSILTVVELIKGAPLVAKIRYSVYDHSNGQYLGGGSRDVDFGSFPTAQVEFYYQSSGQGSRDIKIEVILGSEIVAEQLYPTKFYVEGNEVLDVGFTISNINAVLVGADEWYVYYWDPVREKWFNDGIWHAYSDTVWFNGVYNYGYLLIYLRRSVDGASEVMRTAPIVVLWSGQVVNIDMASTYPP